MQRSDFAVGQGDDSDAGKLELFEDFWHVGLIAGQVVQSSST